jgi:hypothetical protein
MMQLKKELSIFISETVVYHGTKRKNDNETEAKKSASVKKAKPGAHREIETEALDESTAIPRPKPKG